MGVKGAGGWGCGKDFPARVYPFFLMPRSLSDRLDVVSGSI